MIETKMEDVKAGVYPGLSYSEYVEKLPGVRISDLSEMKRSPAHAREDMLHPKESTADQAAGHAFHTFILEPHRFFQEYAIGPSGSRRYKAGKDAWEAFEKANPGKMLLKDTELTQYEGMKAALERHKTASALMFGQAGANELSICWNDPITSLPCKGRLDRVTPWAGWTWIVDLKTALDARQDAFAKSTGQYGYHRAISFYRWGLNLLRPSPRRCAFVVVEKDPPYGVAVHELDERPLEQGEREFRAFLDQYKACVETGVWPAYDEGLGLIDLPPWQVDRVE